MTIDEIANRLYKTDFKYIGLDSCKVRVLQETLSAKEAEIKELKERIEALLDNQSKMTKKIPRPKQNSLVPHKKYDKFSVAMMHFIVQNCVPATVEWDPHEMPYIASEIRVVINGLGSGYIHLLGQDSDTIDFKFIDQ